MKSTAKTRLRVQKLSQFLAGRSSLLIVMQDNPDPDAIAAAVALRKLANTLAGIQCSIAHGGTVGRGENRALVRYLSLNLRQCNEIEFDKFDLTAMVDTQPGAGNNSFPPDRAPDIVFDHHPMRRATRRSQFTDIRSGYGATATILFEYLMQAGITPDVPLATALLYAIRSDTQDLGRQATRRDIRAIGALYSLSNQRMLSEIQRGEVQRGYYRLLTHALQNAKVHGNCIITDLGEVEIPDMIGEVADLLLRDEGIYWTLCYGLFQGKLLLSIRTSQTEVSADKIIRSIVARRGTGGGHASMAGGQIVLKTGNKAEVARIEKIIRQRFLSLLGAGEQPGEKLV
jgi:nanoRNase/pAp phosphatase (c-di-AMP/oligoRNAs hydrolase)